MYSTCAKILRAYFRLSETYFNHGYTHFPEIHKKYSLKIANNGKSSLPLH